MKKVIILTTGGTIASEENSETHLLTSGKMAGEKLVSMCRFDEEIVVETKSVFQVPSNQMTWERLTVLREEVLKAFEDQTVNGIVVTHGTDTLEETAYFLDLTVSDDRPIVVTGSQKAPLDSATDAVANLSQAVLVAANWGTMGIGTLVVFNERIFTARYVEKIHSSNIAGFTSPGFGYLGTVDLNRVYYYQRPLCRRTYEPKGPFPLVDIVKFPMGMDGRLIRASADSGAQGIVIEGAGRGHIFPEGAEEVSNAIAQGLRIVLTSSCPEGLVAPVYDFKGGVHDLQKRGVILGGDYSSKKARIKLSVLMSAGVGDLQPEFVT